MRQSRDESLINNFCQRRCYGCHELLYKYILPCPLLGEECGGRIVGISWGGGGGCRGYLVFCITNTVDMS